MPLDDDLSVLSSAQQRIDRRQMLFEPDVDDASTYRDSRSITTSTAYRIGPRRDSTSTLKKSIAAIAPQCALRNVAHGMCFRLSGAG
jgi:hypothetical protein